MSYHRNITYQPDYQSDQVRLFIPDNDNKCVNRSIKSSQPFQDVYIYGMKITIF